MTDAFLRIETPEGVVFRLRLAGPVSRFLAWIIDVSIIAAVTTALNIVLVPLQVVTPDLALGIVVLGSYILSIGYAIVTEWYWRGQTLGKKVLRLRVMDEAALTLQPNQVVIRNLVRMVDGIPLLYLLGGVTMVLNRKHQRLGDIAANTVVVHSVQERIPDLAAVTGQSLNALREVPHLASRLAQKLTPEEATLGLRALRRRNRLDPQARIEVFRALAEHYRRRVVFPDEVVEHLADEQYVRDVVDVVFQAAPGRRNPANGSP